MQDLMWREGEKYRKLGMLQRDREPSRAISSRGNLSSLFGSLSLKQGTGHSKDSERDEWVEAVDAASGKAYYYNRYTRESRWTRPSAAG